MLFSDAHFFLETLDETIPEMKAARDAFAAGNTAQAEHIFASYLKVALRPDVYFSKRVLPQGEDAAKLIRSADTICEGWLSSCGYAHKFTGTVDWTINPTFNGYKEWTWQLSRHPEFVTLANAYVLTKDEKYAKRFRDLIVSWIDQCECPENISGYATLNWRTIEAGIRMLGAWHVATHTFLHSPSVEDHDWARIFASIWEHTYRLTGFSTSHNWLIMEMGGLINIAVLYPFFRDSKKWFAHGFESLKHELILQLYPDDFQYELSTGYHECNLGNYLNVINLSKKYDIPVPQEFLDGVHRMYNLYVKLARPGYQVPNLNDGGMPDVRTKSRQALATFPGDPIFTYFATEGKEGHAPDFTSIVLPYSGQVVMRTGWDKDAIWAHFDGGPFGFAHQHEDKLNFQMTAYGTHMLTDSGNYAYDSSEQRKYILASRSHNVGLVDGAGQNRRATYHWHDEDISKLAEGLYYRDSEDLEITEGVYNEGYGASLTPVTHKRKVVFFKKGVGAAKPFFLLLDSFEAADGAEHLYEVSFQLNTDPLTTVGRGVKVNFAQGTTLTMLSDVCPKIMIGQYAPEYLGWRSIESREEHEHAPAPVVSFSKKGICARFATVLYPSPNGDAPALGVALTENGFALTVDGERTEFAYDDARLAAE